MRLLHSATSLHARGVHLLARADWLPPLLARITVGWVFVESGWGKLHNLPKVVEYFRSLHIPAPELQAPFAAGSEFLFGLTVLFGLFTRLSTIPLMVIMTVAILTAKRDDLNAVSDLFAFSEFLYILLLIWLLVRGAGAVSLDRLLRRGDRPSGGAAPTAH
jgi:putative oxidoreductase